MIIELKVEKARDAAVAQPKLPPKPGSSP